MSSSRDYERMKAGRDDFIAALRIAEQARSEQSPEGATMNTDQRGDRCKQVTVRDDQSAAARRSPLPITVR